MPLKKVYFIKISKIIKVFVDPLVGLTDADCDIVAKGIGVPDASIPMARDVFKNLYKTYWDTDASLVEINPLILEGNGKIKALDAKFNFDPNEESEEFFVDRDAEQIPGPNLKLIQGFQSQSKSNFFFSRQTSRLAI